MVRSTQTLSPDVLLHDVPLFEDERVRKKPKPKHGIKRTCKLCGLVGHYQKTCQSRPRDPGLTAASVQPMMRQHDPTSTASAAAAAASQLAMRHLSSRGAISVGALREAHQRRMDFHPQGELIIPLVHNTASEMPPLLDSTAQARSVPHRVRLDPDAHTPFIISEGSVGECVMCLSKSLKLKEQGKDVRNEGDGLTCLKCARCGVFLCSTLNNDCWKAFVRYAVFFQFINHEPHSHWHGLTSQTLCLCLCLCFVFSAHTPRTICWLMTIGWRLLDRLLCYDLFLVHKSDVIL